MPAAPDATGPGAPAPGSHAPATVPDTVLAFDVGARRIGIAVGQRFTGDGRGLAVVDNPSHAAALAAIAPLVEQWRPQLLLVGLPLTLDGGGQPALDRARGFARALARRFGLPVLPVDERHSSRLAASRFAEGRRSGLRRRDDAERLDADAAAVLIERFYDQPGQHMENAQQWQT